MLWGHLDVKTMATDQLLWECKNLMKIIITQLRLFIYIPNYGNMHQTTTKLHYKPLCNTIIIVIMNTTFHLIAIRHVAAKKYIQKFWKQTIARDASLCYVIITLFYITFTLQIMSIKVTYPDIAVSNIPITLRRGSFCVCPQPIRVCVTIQHRLWFSEPTHKMILARLLNAMQYSMIFAWFSHIKQVQIV